MNMYQISTFGDLMESKKICATRREVFDHLKKCVDKVNLKRKEDGKALLNLNKIENHCILLKVESQAIPLLGSERAV